MSEVKKRCRDLGFDKYNMNIVDYISKRSVNGYPNDFKHFTKKLFDSAKDFYKKDLTAHFGCVNAIEFSADGNLLFSGGDDRRVLMWNVNDAMVYYTGKLGVGAKPFVMKGCHYSNIFCLAVDDENKRVLSGSNDDRVIVHDYNTGNLVDIFLHESPVFSLSLHPNNGNIFASAVDNGRILLYDIRESNAGLLCVAKLRNPFHGVMFNPCEPSLIATANSKIGVHIWDLRKPKEILIECSDENSMAVRWNQSGTILLALRYLLPIVIYDPLVPKKKLEFDSKTYFNACTMKSCSFAGDNDEYILSGSDDFNLYMWKIPDPWPESRWMGSEHLALTGHRSIVNQVRYSASKQLIASSGVEKVVKLWSPFPMPYSEGDHDKPSTKRHRVLCSSPCCTRSPGFLSHDYSQESVEEDTGMIHFFDSLLQNELEDMTFLPISSIFTLPSRRKETRTYEKLIRRKKKYLSKLLLEKSDESKPICALSRQTTTERPSAPPERPVLNASEEDSSAHSDCYEVTRFQLENSNGETSIDCGTPSSPISNTNYSPSPSSSSPVSNNYSPSPTSSRHSNAHNLSSDSHLSSENLTSSSSSRSKSSVKLFFDSEDSNSNESNRESVRKKLNNMKDSGIHLSDSSDSEEVQTYEFKKKRGSNNRNYRYSSKRRKRLPSTTESSDSDKGSDNKKNSEKNVSENAGTSCLGTHKNKAKGENESSNDDDDNNKNNKSKKRTN